MYQNQRKYRYRAQARELDRRVAEMEQYDFLGIPWETVLEQIRIGR
jgi:hypothetical protein